MNITFDDIIKVYQAMLIEQEEMNEERHRIFDEVAELKKRVDEQERLLHQFHTGDLKLSEYLMRSGECNREDHIRAAAHEHKMCFHGDTREGRIASASFIKGVARNI